MKLRLAEARKTPAPRPMLAPARNPLLDPRRSITQAEAERDMKALPHPDRDRRLALRVRRRQQRDARKAACAQAAIGRLPEPDEALHLLISGRFALWHIVPAIAAIAGRPIDCLDIATLGFNRHNIDELCAMLDAGGIRTARLLSSHYFKSTSPEIYAHAQEAFAQRPDRAAFLSLRTHAKLLLLKLDDGRTFTVESSANLRSCGNIEQLAIVAGPALYEFHRAWLDDLFTTHPRRNRRARDPR